MNKCNYCSNIANCAKCSNKFDLFMPNGKYIKYFHRVLLEDKTIGFHGYIWQYNPHGTSLKATKTVIISGGRYCPYCCDRASPILGTSNIATGYCCFCDKSMLEREYIKKKFEITGKFESTYRLSLEQSAAVDVLKAQYATLLTFDLEGLFELKRRLDKIHFDLLESDVNYFSVAKDGRAIFTYEGIFQYKSI